jgi:metal-dependent amidase/aminoacylase/carboxypeptidase family protein
MQIPHLINLFHREMTAWRQDLHAHPELGFEEQRTSEFVAGKLAEFGCEVHRNIGKTGVVGVLRTGDGPSIGLRADMDALPIHEANDFPYRSKDDGIMHACGHDGHTTMLLGAARYLAERDAYNVIPQTAVIRGTLRTFSNDTTKLIENGMRRTTMGVAAAYGATAKVEFPDRFAPLVNNPARRRLLPTPRLISSARRTSIGIEA